MKKIPTPHNGATDKGQIAADLLMPGDPLRAKFIAENFLHTANQYNAVRNMLGFTGVTHDGHSISVQGSGMGMPSLSIYVHELINNYGVKRIIRVGSCGSLTEELPVNSIVIAQGACTDSNINNLRFPGMNFAPVADWDLMSRAVAAAQKLHFTASVGNILSTDLFYNDEYPEQWKKWAEYGVKAVEMESAELYTLAARFRIQALAILTVSDVLPTGESLSAELRETSFKNMVNIALETLR